MTQLVALLATGKGTWGHVMELTRQQDFENIILITNTFGKEKFSPNENMTMVVADLRMDVEGLRDYLIDKLKPLITGTEIALNMVSGEGKEHMALLAALLKLGVGIRLVVAGEEKMDEL